MKMVELQSLWLSEDNQICGHVGVAGSITSKEERAFRTLLRLDTLRGEDSTGIAGMKASGVTTIVKDALNAYDFLNEKEARKPFEGWVKILMGHNRAATRGAINPDNAHPFEYGDIVGAHNGTLNRYNNLLDGHKFKVDSQAVFYHMSEESVEDLWKNLDGAAALVWINKKDKTLNFLRNDKREFAFTTSTDGKTLFYASEPWMLMVACAREGIEIEKPVMSAVNVHYELHMVDGKLDMKVRELEPYKYVYKPVTTYSYSSSSRGAESYTVIPNDKYIQINKGDSLRFEVDVIRDFTTHQGQRKCNVFGITDNGVPVRMWGIDAVKHEWIIDQMATKDMFFEATVLQKTMYHIELEIKGAFPLYEELGAHEFACEVCGSGVDKELVKVQEGGKIFCTECELDLIALNREGYV